MEFIIDNENEIGLKPITCNFAELKQQLEIKLEKYKHIVYDDTQISLAKSDRALLNKLHETINNKKIEIKKQCLKPYEIFESQVKELLTLIEEPITCIDTQIKEFDNEKKSAKKQKIIETIGRYISSFANLKNCVKFEDIFNDKWLNTSVSMKSIEDAIYAKLEQMDADIKSIKLLNSNYEIELINEYLTTQNMSSVLTKKSNLEKLENTQNNVTKNTNDIQNCYEIEFLTVMNKEQMINFKQFFIDNKINYKVLKSRRI